MCVSEVDVEVKWSGVEVVVSHVIDPSRTGMGSLPLLRSIGHGSFGVLSLHAAGKISSLSKKHWFMRKSSEVEGSQLAKECLATRVQKFPSMTWSIDDDALARGRASGTNKAFYKTYHRRNKKVDLVNALKW